MTNDNPNSEKKEQYRNNAKAVGQIPTHEDWGVANGKISERFAPPFTLADIITCLCEEADYQGITVEELIAKIDSEE